MLLCCSDCCEMLFGWKNPRKSLKTQAGTPQPAAAILRICMRNAPFNIAKHRSTESKREKENKQRKKEEKEKEEKDKRRHYEKKGETKRETEKRRKRKKRSR